MTNQFSNNIFENNVIDVFQSLNSLFKNISVEMKINIYIKVIY